MPRAIPLQIAPRVLQFQATNRGVVPIVKLMGAPMEMFHVIDLFGCMRKNSSFPHSAKNHGSKTNLALRQLWRY